MASDVSQSPFIKQLAANDRPTRDAAVSALRGYLSGRRSLSELELLKLWKGLFFCMWMSDRARTQQRLAGDLAGLVDALPASNTLPFLAAFWTTMAREWNGIDMLRMDKFLLLVRAYLGASLRFLARADWEPGVAKEYAALLARGPLSTEDTKVPNGLRYHVLDIYVDELDRADTPRCGRVPMEVLLGPLRTLAGSSPTKSVRLRAKDALEDERLVDWMREEESRGDADETEEAGTADGKDDEWGGIDS